MKQPIINERNRYVEICNAYLEHSRRLWKSEETKFVMYEDKIIAGKKV